MAISQIGVTSAGAGSGQASITLPTNASGDVLYLYVWGKSNSMTFTTPSGWTLLSGAPYGAGEGKSVCYRIVSNGSLSNPTVTLAGGTGDKHRWTCVSLRGVDNTTPEVDNDWTETTNYSSNPVMPTSAAGGVTCWSIIFLSTATNGGETPSWPSGWTEQDEEHGGAFVSRQFYASNTSPGTGSVGGSTISLSSERGQEKVLQVLVREASSSITGTASFTEPNATLTGAGAVAVAGVAAFTEANETLVAVGAIAIVATSAFTEPNETLSSSVTGTMHADAAFTEPNETLTGAAVVAVSASLAGVEPNETLTGAGAAAVAGSAAFTEPNETLSATGLVVIIGTAAFTEPNETLNSLVDTGVGFPRRFGGRIGVGIRVGI